MGGLRGRLTYANVMSTIAVVIAVGGGTAFAATQLGKNSVKSRNIAPGAVRAPDIANNAVKRLKIAPKAVDASRLADGSVTADKIPGESIEEGKLAPSVKSRLNSIERGSVVRTATTVGSQTTVPEINLISRGPFRLYGKCWQAGGTTSAQVYIASSQPGAIAFGTQGVFAGNPNFLNPGSDEAQRRVATTAIGINGANSFAGSATVILGQDTITFGVVGAAKGTNVAAGDDNNYGGSGSRCVFSPYLTQTAG